MERSRLYSMYSMIGQRNAVFLIDAQVFDIRQHTETWASGSVLEELGTSREQSQVSPETIDDETAHQIPLCVIEKCKRSNKRGEDSAPVDIRNHDRAGSN